MSTDMGDGFSAYMVEHGIPKAPAKADSYFCCSIGERPISVGPMTQDDARGLQSAISNRFPTWIDWRSDLKGREYIDVKNYLTRLRGGPLDEFTDRELIDALKKRGYRVPKRDHVKTATCTAAYPIHELEAMHRTPEWYESAKRNLGRQMGALLMKCGALDFCEEATVFNGVQRLVCSAVVIVDDPSTEIPEQHYGP